MADTIPFEKIKAKYDSDNEVIRRLRLEAQEVAAPLMERIATLEKYQQARETYIMENHGSEAFGFITALYLHGRDDKALAKKVAESVGVDMKKMEAWLLKQVTKVGKSIATDFGTVYKTRKESVGVTDFDAYCDAEVFRPAATALVEELKGNLLSDIIHAEQVGNDPVEMVMEVLKAHAHMDALTKAANKTYVLEAMGEQDEKTGARPNTPPAGVDYKAFATVGVRKAK